VQRWFIRRPWMVAVAVVLVVLVAGGGSAPDRAEAKSARYGALDADLVVRNDGSFHVTETQVVSFQGGPFTTGHRDIPTARTDGITDIGVAEIVDGQTIPYDEYDLTELPRGTNRYSVTQIGNAVQIYWTFAPASDETRTFVVQYDMLGALRSYPDQTPANQQVWWTAVGSALTKETPVDTATVRVTLPSTVDMHSVVAEPLKGPYTSFTGDGKVFTWTHGAFGSGDDFTVRLQFPVILPNVAAPDWQAADDAQRAREQKSDSRTALVHLFMLAIGLLVVGGGSSGLYGLWYVRGRDPHVGLIADFLPQPPDDLSPGAAGTLIDETANDCDIIATLLDLVRRGVIGMSDGTNGEPSTRALGGNYVFELKQAGGTYEPHERRMLETMFGREPKAGATAALTSFSARVRSDYEEYRSDLYRELVQKGYFVESPDATRHAWRRTSRVVMAAAVVVLGVGWIAFDAWIFIPAIAIFLLGLALRRLGGAMPRKTAAGAEAAAKWTAFKRYLSDIEKYEKVKESRQIFDRFLSYAIAFGIETGWVAAFARTEPAPSMWQGAGAVFIPYGMGGWGSPHHGGTYVGTGGGGGIDLPNLDLPNVPSLQTMSNRASSGVQESSSGLMGVLKVAGAILEIASQFSGGGGSGGSSGGGGGGFK
jgi:hypothetical protein